MIQQDLETELKVLLKFIRENFPVIAILLVLIGVGIFFLIRFIRNQKESRKHLIGTWKKLTAKHEKLTNRLSLIVYPFGRKSFEIRGDIYIIDSRIHEQEYTASEIVDKSLKEIEREIKRIQTEKEAYKEKYPSFQNEELNRFDRRLEILNQDKKHFEQIKKQQKKSPKTKQTQESKKIIIKEKTETYAALHQNRIVGFRYTDLKPTQNVLSQTGFLELSRIDPRRSKFIYWLVIVIELIYQLILMWAIVEETGLDFLVEMNMWGWYATLLVVIIFTIYIIYVIMGFYAIVYAKQVTNEDIILQDRDNNPFTINIEVFWIKTFFYPQIKIEEVLDINIDTLVKEVNQENRKLISELSTENATLRGELEFMQNLLNRKSQIIDRMEERILTERALGYYEGRQDNTATPMFAEEHRVGLGIDWNLILYRSIPFAFGLIALVLLAFAVKFVADSIHLTEIQMTLLLVIGGLLIGGFVLITLRGVFESTRRSPVG